MGTAGTISRRSLLGATLAAVLPVPARAVGIPGGPDLIAAVESLSAAIEGNGQAVLHVLFTPWCHESPAAYRESRGLAERLTVRWVPFSGGLTEGRQAAELLLRNPDPALVPGIMRPGRWRGPMLPTPLCDAQDAAIVKGVEPLIIRDTGRPMTTPTLVFAIPNDRVRIVPGWLDRARLEEVAGIADPGRGRVRGR